MNDEPSSSATIENLSNRLHKLEKQALWWRRLLSIVSIVAGAVLIMAQTHARRVIDAEEFRVRDGSKTVARLTSDSGKAVLTLSGQDEKPRVLLSVTDTGSTSVFADSAGHVRTGLSASTTGSELVFLDLTGKETMILKQSELGSSMSLTHGRESRAGFSVEPSGADPVLMLNNVDGAPYFIGAIHEGLPTLELYDSTGRRVLLSVRPNGPGLTLFHTNKQTGIALGINRDAPIFGLLGTNGKDLFSVPTK